MDSITLTYSMEQGRKLFMFSTPNLQQYSRQYIKAYYHAPGHIRVVSMEEYSVPGPWHRWGSPLAAASSVISQDGDCHIVEPAICEC